MGGIGYLRGVGSDLHRHLAAALTASYVCILWLQHVLAHDGHGAASAWLWHWLRDGTLALPAVLVAWVVARRLQDRWGRRVRPEGTVLLPALAVTVALGVSSPLHHLLETGALPSLRAGVDHGVQVSLSVLPVALLFVVVTVRLRRAATRSASVLAETAAGRAAWALTAGLACGWAALAGNLQHLPADHDLTTLAFLAAGGREAALAAAVGFLLIGLAVSLTGTPWAPGRPAPAERVGVVRPRAAVASVVGLAVIAVGQPNLPVAEAQVDHGGHPGFTCESLPGTRTIVADVVALDQSIVYNRLGVTNPHGMIYALRRDVVVDRGPDAGRSEADGATLTPGNVTLRSDERPRPLVLRANVGDCLEVRFQNLLDPTARGSQPVDRHVGIHAKGVSLVDSIADDSSFVGRNDSSLAAPGERRTYRWFAEHENAYLLENLGTPTGGEGAGGTTSFGLFGALNVEPYGSQWFRSKVTRDDMDRATVDRDEDGQPVIDHFARDEDGVPVLAMLDGDEIVHSDLDAIIAGPPEDDFAIPRRAYPESYWDNEIHQLRSQRGQEPFREFTTIWHDEIEVEQAFDLFAHPDFAPALHSVKDGFAINYGSGGIGAEIIANRFGVGPMAACVDCKYEEFFLTSWVVGDPAMIVDVPANTGCTAPEDCATGPKATKVLYPDDPSNVHHSYLNDRTKFRNLHAGPAEHHIFHLHAHQWQYTPNSADSSYLDSQLIGPGSGYTYEIAYGGSGNRNKTPGDSIFHCHFYPHFAQGMWELWRVHDTFEAGTPLDDEGRPRPGSRALPDGEITAGTPIPGVVPLPSLALAPAPDPAATVVAHDLSGDGTPDSSQLDVDGDGVADLLQIDEETGERFAAEPDGNPGFPYFVPGVAGHRPPTAPMDLVDVDGDGQPEDGGLPRHLVLDGEAVSYETRLDFNKELKSAEVAYLPEDGTAAERAAMDFHATRWHDTARSDGARPRRRFEANGLPPVPGAPYAEPCRSDTGTVLPRTRTYKGAVLQIDAVLNKAGWHFPQQRLEALWDDVGATLTGARPAEPLVMRLGVEDCADFWHTNLVPSVYELDDYQVRTPTDVIGQHIHLVKFDVLSADGSANGFNYEDGTFSPHEVEERVHAVREGTNRAADAAEARGDEGAEDLPRCTGNDRVGDGAEWTPECPLVRRHPFFGEVDAVGDDAWGARTSIQRWFADPLLNDAWDQGLGTVFTHDHFGPSTHQQVGLYSTVLVEPEASRWRDPETGTVFGSRHDGGPTSWRADIYWARDGTPQTPDPSDPRNVHSHREFYLELSDFQHAYQAGGGRRRMVDNGAGVMIPSYADHRNAINPPFRQHPPAGREADLFFHPNRCQNGHPRPCPEAISADDPGTFVVNYRNEPVGLRVFDPRRSGQTRGAAGDLALAYQSRTDRAIAELNRQPAVGGNRPGVNPGDPYTPLLRVYAGDQVRFRTQVGGHEEQHNLTIHGVKWLQESMAPNSGWRNSVAGGISEYSNMEVPVIPDLGPGNPQEIDYRYTLNASVDGEWNGIWGILRSYNARRNDLLRLPSNDVPASQGNRRGWAIQNAADFDQVCPRSAPVRRYRVTAVRAADVLGPAGLVYNDRTTAVRTEAGAVQGAGPLHDPTALLYVPDAQLIRDDRGRPVGLTGDPQPLVLRANAGDCLKVQLTNALPTTVPDLPGYSSLPPIVHKDEDVQNGGVVTFNANDMVPSSLVGLHPQLLQYDVRRNDGSAVGGGSGSLVPPGSDHTYTWYAGTLHNEQVNATTLRVVARPVEYGAINLSPPDRIKGSNKGFSAALVVEPPGASWPDAETHATSTTVTFPDGRGGTTRFREHVTVLQSDVNLRYGGSCAPTPANLRCAVPSIASEGAGIAEDNEDAGQRAINYGAEPLWYRLGIAPDAHFRVAARDPRLHQVYANALAGDADPQTPVFTATAGDTVRMRLLYPGGHMRGTVFTINGHSWQREPYVVGTDPPSSQRCSATGTQTLPCGSDRLAWTFHGDPTRLDGIERGEMFGHQMVSWWTSSQEGLGASSHFDLILPQAGGPARVPGDYLFRDNASFGNYQGLWGILRVEE